MKLVAAQVKSTCVDVLGGSLDGNRENLDSHNEKRRLVENPDEGIMFDGEFERIMFDDKRRISSKPEEEEGAPQLAEFCRLCYCRLDFYLCDLLHHFHNHHSPLTAWLEPQWTNT